MAFIEKRKRKHSDKKDGYWVKDAPGLNVLMTGLYPKRCDNEICSFNEIDVTELIKFIKDFNEKNPDHNIGFFHCILAALVRMTNERRKLNYFVRHGRIYERNEISVSFIAKKQFKDNAHESVIVYKAKKDDNVVSIADYIKKEVAGIRKEETLDKKEMKKKDPSASFDSFGKWPRWFMLLVTRFVRILNYYGNVPASLKKGDPAWASILISNLGSIKAPSVYHHLNEYGNNSVMYTIGTLYKREVIKDDGTKEVRDFINLSMIADERIADGLYFINSLKLFKKYMQNPDKLLLKFDDEVKFDD